MQQAMPRMGAKSDPLFQQTCAVAARLGPPDYFQLYMIAHGMKAFQTKGGKVTHLSRQDLAKNVKRVNTTRVWRESLNKVNGCP